MLDQKRIPIGKLKKAFDLDDHDVEKIISALWPHEIFPYALWEMEYLPRWKDAASHNTIFYKAKMITSFPEFDTLEHQLPLLHIYRRRIITFFNELATVIFVSDLREGLDRIVKSTYDTDNISFSSNIEYLYDGLSRIESELNFKVYAPFTWASNITPERFTEVFNDKCLFISSSTGFIDTMFTDTIVINKQAALRYLSDCGYPLRQEVKGISKAIAERIAAPLDAEIQAAPVTEAPAAHPQKDIFVTPTMPGIVVPRALWEGKSPESVRDGMRKEGFHDAIIAKVLVDWCKVNKTLAGSTLGPHGNNETDSASRHRIYKLLQKAAAYTISAN